MVNRNYPTTIPHENRRLCNTVDINLLNSKCIAVTFSRKKKKDRDLNLLLNNIRIVEKDNFKFLRIIFDSKITWDNHIDYVNASLLRRAN